jgi:elongation factor Ts
MDLTKVKQLRDETGAGVLEIKLTLEKTKGDLEKARKELMSKVGQKAEKKAGRNAADGLVYSYVHNTGKVGSMILLACETDFVARTEDFRNLCKEIAMQICTDDFTEVKQILNAEYMRDPGKKVGDLIKEMTAKVGEKIELKKFIKYSITD